MKGFMPGWLRLVLVAVILFLCVALYFLAKDEVDKDHQIKLIAPATSFFRSNNEFFSIQDQVSQLTARVCSDDKFTLTYIGGESVRSYPVESNLGDDCSIYQELTLESAEPGTYRLQTPAKMNPVEFQAQSSPVVYQILNLGDFVFSHIVSLLLIGLLVVMCLIILLKK